MLKSLSNRLGFGGIRQSNIPKTHDAAKEHSNKPEPEKKISKTTNETGLHRKKRSLTDAPPRNDIGPDGRAQEDFN